MDKKEYGKKAVLAAALFLTAFWFSACTQTKEFSVLSGTKKPEKGFYLQETKAARTAAESAVSEIATESAAKSAAPGPDRETAAETAADVPRQETLEAKALSEETAPKEPPQEKEPLSYNAYLELFEAMDSSVRAFYWEVYEAEIRSALSEEEYGRLRAFALAETAEDKAGGESERKFDEEAAREAFALQNQIREEEGLAPLIWDEEIYRLACSRVSQAAENFSHEGCPEGYGENLASGSAGDGAQMMERLYASEEHRANILGAAYTRGAIAVSGGLWVAMYHE